MTLSVIDRARRYIAKCPPGISGQGGHNATYHVAAVLVNGFALSDVDAMGLMLEWNRWCEPRWSERELRHKVESATRATHRSPRGHLLGPGDRPSFRAAGRGAPMPPRPAPPDPLNATVGFLNGFRCAEQDLAEASLIRMEGDWRFDGALLVGTLYQPAEQINFVTGFEKTQERNGEVKARPKGHGLTVQRDALVTRFEQHGTDTGEAGAWLRMNPTDGKGIGDANVAAFRFALLESDTLPAELQLSLIARLPLPISAILSSGGRSYHAWVRVDARDAADYRRMVSRLLELVGKFGVDRSNKNPSRMSRLPGAKRCIGAVGDGIQRLLYLNPEPKQRRILE
jgi:hypothetical protein